MARFPWWNRPGGQAFDRNQGERNHEYRARNLEQRKELWCSVCRPRHISFGLLVRLINGLIVSTSSQQSSFLCSELLVRYSIFPAWAEMQERKSGKCNGPWHGFRASVSSLAGMVDAGSSIRLLVAPARRKPQSVRGPASMHWKRKPGLVAGCKSSLPPGSRDRSQPFGSRAPVELAGAPHQDRGKAKQHEGI